MLSLSRAEDTNINLSRAYCLSSCNFLVRKVDITKTSKNVSRIQNRKTYFLHIHTINSVKLHCDFSGFDPIVGVRLEGFLRKSKQKQGDPD